MNRRLRLILNSAVTAFMLTGAAKAHAADLDYLFQRLAVPDLAEWEDIERQIEQELSQSGSPAMDLLLQRGRDAMQSEKFPEAVDHFTALIDHAPDFAEGWTSRATAFFAQDRIGLALADLEHALALEPRHFTAWEGLGLIMTQMGQDDLALRAFQQAAAIHPNDPTVKEHLIRLERAMGDVAL